MSDPEQLDFKQMTLRQLADAAQFCTACELYANATQVVFGDGQAGALLMLLGEQPGDREDKEGEPFVGPSGHQLDIALERAGIDRRDVYVTNIVKHFRFEERGKRRLHKSPARRHVEACRPWLNAELSKVRPRVIVCLGSSAAHAILGSSVRVMTDHGVPVEWEGFQVVPTIHPSFVLRATDKDRRSELLDLLVEDLERAVQIARSEESG
jgi:uracil-DNA glycosylase